MQAILKLSYATVTSILYFSSNQLVNATPQIKSQEIEINKPCCLESPQIYLLLYLYPVSNAYYEF